MGEATVAKRLMKNTMSKGRDSFRILIVDDNKAFLQLVAELLKSVYDHIHIETALSGNECLRKVRNFSPNLVLLDIGMNGMNGLVTLRFIKSINSDTLVYLLSGLSEEYLKDAMAMVPADGYFTKTDFIDSLQGGNPLPMIAKTISAGE